MLFFYLSILVVYRELTISQLFTFDPTGPIFSIVQHFSSPIAGEVAPWTCLCEQWCPDLLKRLEGGVYVFFADLGHPVVLIYLHSLWLIRPSSKFQNSCAFVGHLDLAANTSTERKRIPNYNLKIHQYYLLKSMIISELITQELQENHIKSLARTLSQSLHLVIHLYIYKNSC